MEEKDLQEEAGCFLFEGNEEENHEANACTVNKPVYFRPVLTQSLLGP